MAEDPVKARSKDRKFALWNWGNALLEKEQFDEAIEKYALATEIVPQTARAFLYYGSSLAKAGRYRDSIAQYNKASKLDPGDPYPRHNRAESLFQLGRYEEGWDAWRTAWLCYEHRLNGNLRGAEQLEMAVNYADLLRDMFRYYETAKGFYELVLKTAGRQRGCVDWTCHSLPAVGGVG